MLQAAGRTVKAAFQRSSFVMGAGRALDIGSTLKLSPPIDVDFMNEPLYGDQKSDYDRLRSDWMIVGRDFMTAICVAGGSNDAEKGK